MTILNPAPMSRTLNRDLLKLADVICPNETEVMFTKVNLTILFILFYFLRPKFYVI